MPGKLPKCLRKWMSRMKDFSTPIKKVFQRSINIVSDLDNRVLLETFLPSTTGNNTLLEFCTQVQSKQGAFTWTGAYGSGKSTLAVILLSLLRQKIAISIIWQNESGI